MKVKYIKNRGDQISRKYIEAGLAFESTIYNSNIGDEVNVYGVFIRNGMTMYLIADVETYGVGYIPIWSPADLFEIVDKSMPSSLYCTYYYQDNDDPITMWGYNELVNDPDHYDRLVECYNPDVEIFQIRKDEIDKEI